MNLATKKIDRVDKKAIVRFTRPDWRKSLWQVTNTFIPYLIVIAGMYFSLRVSYWLTIALAIPAAGLMVRIFIIFHDCGHGSFFKSKRANSILGFIAGVFTFFPYQHWTHKHAQHHAAAGQHADAETIANIRAQLNLDKPVIVQYFMYLKNLVQGDLGTSFITQQNVREALLQAFPLTLNLALLSVLITAVIGIPIGILSAVKQYSMVDRNSDSYYPCR